MPNETSAPSAEPEVFKNILEVATYLAAAGLKVSKSTLYRHRSEGRIRADEDGSFTREAVRKYTKTFLKRKDGSKAKAAAGAMPGDDKLVLEVRKLAADTEYRELKTGELRRDLIDRSFVVALLARRLLELKNSLENFIRSSMSELCGILNGDPTKIPDAIEFGLKKLYKFLGRYARDPALELPKQDKIE